MAIQNTQKADPAPQQASENGSLKLLKHDIQNIRLQPPANEDDATMRLSQALLNFYLIEGEEDFKRVCDAQTVVDQDPDESDAPDDLLDGRLTPNNRGLQDMLQPLKKLSPAMAAAVRTFEEMLLRCISREALTDALRQQVMAKQAQKIPRMPIKSEIHYTGDKINKTVHAHTQGAVVNMYEMLPSPSRPAMTNSKPKLADTPETGTAPTD